MAEIPPHPHHDDAEAHHGLASERPPAVSALLDAVREHARERGVDRRGVTVAVGLVVAALVAAWLVRPSPAPIEETLPMAATSAPAAAGPSATTGAGGAAGPEVTPGAGPASGTGAGSAEASDPTSVIAHAAGAVARPGVYQLGAGSRVDDLVAAAGGLAPDADVSRLNLAAPVLDGSRVYVPRTGEEVPEALLPEVAAPPETDAGTGGPTGSPGGAGEGGLIDLNTADEAALDTLPGVGPATAAAIVAHRAEAGPFTTVEQLLDVRGIGEAKLEQIRPLVTV